MTLIFNQGEFLVLQHRKLNNKEPELYKLADQVELLAKYTNGRKPILALEGDLVEEEGTLFLAHKYDSKSFKTLRELGIASYFEETLDHIAKIRPETFLNIELKPGITQKGMRKAVALLKERDLTNYLYDSFFGKELDTAHEQDPYAITSHHLLGYVYRNIGLPSNMPKHEPTIVTIPYMFTIGNPTMPMIAGFVNNYETFQKVAEKDNVVGSAARFDDDSLLKVLKKSLSP